MNKTIVLGWAKLAVAAIVGAAIPGLLAWGSMQNQITSNKTAIEKKLDMAVFVMYEKGIGRDLNELNTSVKQITEMLYEYGTREGREK